MLRKTVTMIVILLLVAGMLPLAFKRARDSHGSGAARNPCDCSTFWT